MNNYNILIFLMDRRSERFTINQISKATGINYRIVYEQIQMFKEEGIIETERAGNSLLCSLTGHFNEKVFHAEYLRRRKALEDKDLDTVTSRFVRARQNYILLLFGSYAKRKNTQSSDIDLLAVTENEKELIDIKSLVPKDIHLTCVSYDAFLRMRDRKDTSVVSEAMKNNIILIGIEDYYRLLDNDK